MQDFKNALLIREEQSEKPLIEDVITDNLDDCLKVAALDFVVHMKDNKMPLRFGKMLKIWTELGWGVNYKSKPICRVVITPNSGFGYRHYYKDPRPDKHPCWYIVPRLTNMETYKESIINENLQNIIWNNATYCVYGERSPYFNMDKAPGCSPNKSCAPGKNIIVLDKEIKNNCDSFGITIWNPDITTINGLKRLLALEKKARDDLSKTKGHE